LEKVHFSIRQILEDVYALFERQSQRNNSKLSYSLSPDTPPVLLGDPYRLKQIMINLVSNSVKFTNDGQVHFSVKGIERTPFEIDLEMEFVDTGIGIDEKKLDFIFEDFTQEEMSTSRKYGGTGLGLSIVKKLVELHNGKITCKSRKNHGTRITCLLPYLTGDESKVNKDVEKPLFIPEEVRALKILIVDDEKYNRQLFKMILERWKVDHHEVSSGVEALELLKTNRFNMVFMDARMPGIDGLQTTEIIRNEMNISESEMPVICFSAAALNEDWQKYQKAGMNSFLPKPFTEEMLLATILSLTRDYIPGSIIDIKSEEKNEPATSGNINLQNLYHISAGDEQFVRQMLDSFIHTTKKGLDEIAESVMTGQLDKVSELAHKLMSPCHHIGAMSLYNLLVAIEKGAVNRLDAGKIESLIVESVKEFEDIRELLNRHITKMA
jgi:CheY-like chemotaxis protein